MYKARIEFRAIEDDYNEGEIDTYGNIWEEVLTADTQAELRNKILDITYSEWKDLNDEQMNEYDWCTEYHTSYVANAENIGEASKSEIESWSKGKTRLWNVHCHILVTEVTEKKASL